MQDLSDVLRILSRLNAIAIVDILLVAILVYGFLQLIRGTQAVQLLRGMILVILIVVLISGLFQLTAFNWLLRNVIPALLVSIPIVFQPELRRALERLGRAGGIVSWSLHEEQYDWVVDQIVEAAGALSQTRHGALIVLERDTGLQEYIDTGTQVGGILSADLLRTIFFPNTALHDGAVIIRDGRIVAATCVLPLSETAIPVGHLGTRHRAAIGATEETDAISVVVSEETGMISLARAGRMARYLDERRLRTVLTDLLRPQTLGKGPLRWLREKAQSIQKKESDPQ